ncbi:GNAT family N-acetyltransferase [Qipengyuania sediminis]|uniref:GNAT family N-acetyltransferase n=1 Tax=Qipengyuania sediminis TaxID=1532023 RepID=UPI0010596366|nr:GNAT family N-acetyltransferase [Qipengyuania sediminis]
MIRAATEADVPALGGIAEAAGLFPAAMLPEMITPYFAGSGEDRWWTVEIEGRAAGFVFCEPERFTNATWNMRAIAVAPGLQSRGIGAALMRNVEEELRARDGRVLIVETDSALEHRRTCAFYLREAYREAARIADFWDEGIDKIVFWKKLTQPPAG